MAKRVLVTTRTDEGTVMFVEGRYMAQEIQRRQKLKIASHMMMRVNTRCPLLEHMMNRLGIRKTNL